MHPPAAGPTPFAPRPPLVTAALDSAYGPDEAQRVDVFLPQGGEERALVVCLPGGWWSTGRHDSLRGFCLALAARGWPCASVGLRPLPPPGQAPGAGHARDGGDVLEDARLGAERALEEALVLGLAGRSVLLLGSGSGSLAALVLAQRLGEQRGGPQVRAVAACGVTPSLDHVDVQAAPLHKAVERFAGVEREALSPSHLDPARFPPLLLLHGDADHEISAKAAGRLRDKISTAGVPCELVPIPAGHHQFIEDPQARPGHTALERLLPFLAEHGSPVTAA